jgi:glutathione S-transferase
MPLDLHWVSGSPYAWRVQLALVLKGQSYVSHRHQFTPDDIRGPAYLALNPRGRVPTLVHDGFVLYESIAILAYLDRRFPDPPLFGRTPEETGLVWRHIAEYTAYVDVAAEDYIVPLYFGSAGEHADAVRNARGVILAELDRWNAHLAGAEWLVGTGITAADVVLFPALKSVERASGKELARTLEVDVPPTAERWPNLAAWAWRIEALPGVASTWPPHWGPPPGATVSGA